MPLDGGVESARSIPDSLPNIPCSFRLLHGNTMRSPQFEGRLVTRPFFRMKMN
jgi:hypothetical protein